MVIKSLCKKAEKLRVFLTLGSKASAFQYKEGVNTEWNYCEAENIRLFSQVILLAKAETRHLIHKDLY